MKPVTTRVKTAAKTAVTSASATRDPQQIAASWRAARSPLGRALAMVTLLLVCAQSLVAQEADPLEQVREQLAELELDFAVERDYERMEAELKGLIVDVLSAPADREALPVMATLFARWAGLLMDQGRMEEAAEVLLTSSTAASGEWLRDTLELSQGQLIHLGYMGPGLVKTEAIRAQVARLEALHEEEAGGVSSELVEAVKVALEAGQFEDVKELGLRAVPALEALVDLSQDAKSAFGPRGHIPNDPLYWLFELDRERAMQLVRRALDEGRAVDVARVAILMLRTNTLGQDDLWFASGDGRARFLKPEWQEVITEFLSQGKLPTEHSGDVFDLVNLFAVKGAFSEDLTVAVGDVFFRPDFQELDALRAVLLNGNFALTLFRRQRSPTLQPLLDGLVTHPDDAVRLRAAKSLVAHEHSDALLGRFADPNVLVRAEVARALGVRWVDLNGGKRAQVYPRMEPADIALLERLAADESKHVRLEAARSLASHRLTAADEAGYLALARDPDPSVREALTALIAGDLALRRRVLEVLAVDADPRVRLAVAKRSGDPPDVALALLELLCADADSAVRKAAVLSVSERKERDLAIPLAVVERLVQDPDPAVRARLPDLPVAGPEVLAALLLPLARDAYPDVLERVDHRIWNEAKHPSWEGTDEWLLPVFQARLFNEEKPYRGDLPMNTTEGRRQVIRWAIETGDQQFWMQVENGVSLSHWRDAWLGLTDEELAELFAQAYVRNTPGKDRVLGKLEDIGPGSSTPRPGVGRLLFNDESLPAPLRIKGAATYANEATPRDVDAWIALLGSLKAAEDLDWVASDDWARSLGWRVPDSEQVRFAQEVWALDLPNDVADMLIQGVIRRQQPDVGVLREVMDRWYSRDGESFPSVSDAFYAMQRVPEAVDTGLLKDAVRSQYADRAVRTMAYLVDEQFTEVLGDYLTTEAANGSRNLYREEASEGLVRLMSDGAIEQLLRAAAWTTSSAAREKYMAGVATIQDYQDSLAAWEARKHRVATRDETVRELRTLLTSDNPLLRAEAARSLGTLGAVDQLPALIRLLEDKDARVVAAAQAALDSMHAAADALSEKPSDG